MSTFRLAIVDRCRETQCLELQQNLTNEKGKAEWVHYCIVVSPAQALEIVGQKDPALLATAQADLADGKILDSAKDRSLEVRVAKNLLKGWRK